MFKSNLTTFLLAGLLLFIFTGLVLYFIFTDSGETNEGPLGGIFGGRGRGLPITSDNNIEEKPDNLPDSSTDNITEEAKARLIQLTNEPTIGATINRKGDRVMYFKRSEGKIFELPFDGGAAETQLSYQRILGIINAEWSSQKTYSLVMTLNGDNPNSFWLRFTGTSTVLTGQFPEPFTSASFSPSEEKLALFGPRGNSYAVFTTDGTGKNVRTIHTTPVSDYEVAWADKSTLSLKTRSSGEAPSLLQLMPAGGGLPAVIESGNGLEALWNNSGTQYLLFRTSQNGRSQSLTVKSRTGTDSKPLNITTLAEKCVFSALRSVLYCAVPRVIGREVLPDAWWKGKVSFDDNLWEINISTGEHKTILENTNFDMTHLFTSPNENFIFFLNKKDSTLWSYRLL